MTREQARHFAHLGLSTRTCGVLQARGLDTPDAVRALTDDQFARLAGIGPVSREELYRAGLRDRPPEQRRPVSGGLRVDAYAVLDRAVEEGVALGFRRARKHTDAPDEDTLQEHVHREVMGAISEMFRFDERDE